MFYNGILLGQSGFSSLHGDIAGISHTAGQPFYRQFADELIVYEGVEQSYLLTDTIFDDWCEATAYDNYGFQYGDTLTAGGYTAANYSHSAQFNYDSVSFLYLEIHPKHVVFDTLLLPADDLRGYIPGTNSDTLVSQFGCDSILNQYVCSVECPSVFEDTAAYGVESVPFALTPPEVLPVSTPMQILSDAPSVLEVGTTANVVWQIILSTDTFLCTQEAIVHFPPCGGDFTAIDGDSNLYETVRMGADCWLKQNMHTTRFSNGDTVRNPILHTLPGTDTLQHLHDFGYLYDWYDAAHLQPGSTDTPLANAEGEIQGICPDGWHLPSLAELEKLARWNPSDLKAESDYWLGFPNENGSHFSAMPAGTYSSEIESGKHLRTSSHLWSDSATSPGTAAALVIPASCTELEQRETDKNDGCSVRCVKD